MALAPARFQYTPEERNMMLMAYTKYKGNRNVTRLVQEEFREQFPLQKVPLQSTIYRIWRKQNFAYTVHNLNSEVSPGPSHSGRPRTVTIPENIQAVKDMLDRDCEKENDDPDINTCRQNELGLTKTTMSRIIKHHLHYHCYKCVFSKLIFSCESSSIFLSTFIFSSLMIFRMIKSQELKDTDLERRVGFANHILTNMTDPDLINTAFSDEATFTMDGMVNSQNVRRYAKKKVRGVEEGGRPEKFRHTHNKYPAKVMVFLGVHGSGQTWGLKIYQNQTIDGAEYYKLLRYKAIPQLKRLNGGTLAGMSWQQDRAKVHRTKKVMQYLDGQFGRNMLALDSIQGVEWPPRSPDLNPLDFFVW